MADIREGPDGLGAHSDIAKPQDSISGPRAENIMQLSDIDQFQARGYVRVCLCWSTHSDPLAIVGDLQCGLKAIVTRWPFLAGKLYNIGAQTGEQQGRVEIRYREGDSFNLRVKHLAAPEYPYTFDQLSNEAMPASKLRTAVLSALPDYPDPSAPADCAGFQANFVCGGLILVVYINHAVVDGPGMGLVLRELAANCRSRTNLHTNVAEEDLATRVSLSRQKVNREKLEGHDEARCGPVPRQIQIRHSLPQSTGRLFMLPVKYLRVAQRDLTRSIPELVPDSDEGLFISLSNTLCAILWHCITKARRRSINQPLSTFALATNLRGRCDSPISDSFIGNGAFLTYTTMNMDSLHMHLSPLLHWYSSHNAESSISPQDSELTALRELLTRTALSIRRSIQTVTASRVQSLISYVSDPEKVPDVRSLVPNVDFSYGPDMIVTSWDCNSLYSMDFGPVIGGCPLFFRKIWCTEDGVMVILPKRVEGDEEVIEVNIQLAVEDMERLEQDEGWMSMVRRVVE